MWWLEPVTNSNQNSGRSGEGQRGGRRRGWLGRRGQEPGWRGRRAQLPSLAGALLSRDALLERRLGGEVLPWSWKGTGLRVCSENCVM